jgi:hypothetical protein
MCYPPEADGILDGSGNVFLVNDFFKSLGAPLAGKY